MPAGFLFVYSIKNMHKTDILYLYNLPSLQKAGMGV